VGKAGQTLSATDFAELTGVSRERLRTWERRHGFPEPVRSHGGARRYAVDDVARVVAVRRAVEAGTPVTAAVAAAGPPPDDGVSAGTRSALAEHAPVAVVVLSGPEPLRVEWVNALVRHRPGAPAAGDELFVLAPWFADDPGAAVLRELFSGDGLAAACTHPDWTEGLRPGGEVRLAGVRIGKVDDVRLLPPTDNPNDPKVEAVLALDSKIDGKPITDLVRTDSSAQLATPSLLGSDRMINITPGTSLGNPVQEGQSLRTTTEGGMAQLTASGWCGGEGVVAPPLQLLGRRLQFAAEGGRAAHWGIDRQLHAACGLRAAANDEFQLRLAR